MLLKVLEFTLIQLDVVVGTGEDVPGLSGTVSLVVTFLSVNPLEAIEKPRRNIRAQIILMTHGIT